MAPLAWVPWIPGNPSIFEQWVPEPLTLGKNGLKLALFSVQGNQEIGVGSLGNHQSEFLTKPLFAVRVATAFLKDEGSKPF